jgi:hypothetical protein
MSGLNKVIGIGLPKTATSSLAGALNNNGIKTIHFGDGGCEEIRQKMYNGIYKFDVLNNFQGVTNAFEMVFPQVDKIYPGSKFIHTVRDKDAWLNSAEKHFVKYSSRPEHHLITYGSYKFNKDRFSFVYDSHLLMVKNYFNDRKNDVLTLDITKNNNYVYEVCSFLGISVKNAKPLHLNKD